MNANETLLRRNVSRIQVMGFFWMFLLIMPVVVPFLESHRLSMREILTLQSLFAILIVMLEVPSGYVSDLIGRRRCLIAAGFLHGLAMTWLAMADSFWGFAGYQVIAAFGVTLWSGSDVALMYDSLEALGDKEGRRRILGRRLLWLQGGETTAALLSAWFVIYSLQTVAVANAVFGWFSFFVALTLVETNRGTLDKHDHLGNMRTIYREVFQASPLLRLIMFNLIAYGLATLIAVWAFQGLWEATGVPLPMFGILWAAYNLTVAIVGRAAHRIEDALGARLTVLLVGLLPVIGYLGLSASASGIAAAGAIAVAFGFCFQVGRGLTQVVIKDALNVRVRTELRATANSISSMGVRLIFAVVGPIMGHLIDSGGYTVAMGSFAGFFAVVLIAFNIPLARRLVGVDTLNRTD